MTTVVAHAAADFPEPALPKLGKVAIERRRRPLTLLVGFFMGVIVFTTGSRWPVAGGGREVLFLIGMLLACVGAFGRIWSNLFISGFKSKFLISTGPYSVSRNPLYFFSAIGMVGIGLTTETLSIPALFIVFFALYYPTIIHREEQRLLMRHGEAFAEYCRRTPAFWPQLSLYDEPEVYVMHPRAMRKNICDAFWFVALAAVVHMEAQLSALSGLPTVFNLW
jgi:protein-S-isoprenylcysteine O-methyltransferase Ste14